MKYNIELNVGNRLVEADGFQFEDGWMIFFRRPAQGGIREYWRVRVDTVVCMETCQ